MHTSGTCWASRAQMEAPRSSAGRGAKVPRSPFPTDFLPLQTGSQRPWAFTLPKHILQGASEARQPCSGMNRDLACAAWSCSSALVVPAHASEQPSAHTISHVQSRGHACAPAQHVARVISHAQPQAHAPFPEGQRPPLPTRQDASWVPSGCQPAGAVRPPPSPRAVLGRWLPWASVYLSV